MNSKTSWSGLHPSPFRADAFPELAERVTGKILIIDYLLNFSHLPALLTRAGHQVQRVETEKQGLHAMMIDPPDLLLIDVGLPETAAYQLCGFLQTVDSTRHTPIIFLDSENECLHKVQAFRYGAADYLAQPFDAVEVLVRIEAQLRVRQQRQKQAQLEAKICQLQEQISDLMTAVTTLEALNQELEVKLQSDPIELKTSELADATALRSQPELVLT